MVGTKIGRFIHQNIGRLCHGYSAFTFFKHLCSLNFFITQNKRSIRVVGYNLKKIFETVHLDNTAINIYTTWSRCRYLFQIVEVDYVDGVPIPTSLNDAKRSTLNTNNSNGLYTIGMRHNHFCL